MGGGELVGDEYAGEQLEEVFLVRTLALCGVMLLPPVVALGVHLPVLASKTSHDAELSCVPRQRGVESVEVHLIYEPVVEGFVLYLACAFPRVGVISLLRGILLAEVSVISCLQLQCFSKLVLVVEFHLPRAVADKHRTVLILICGGVRIIICAVLIVVLVVSVPVVIAYGEVYPVVLFERVLVAQLSVNHTHIAVAGIPAEHPLVVVGSTPRPVVVECGVVIVMTSQHSHTTQR